MKTTSLIVALAVTAGAMLFTACKKYDEGPAISLKSKTARLAQKWKAEKVIDGASGADITTYHADQFWEYTDGGTVNLGNSSGSVSGTWAFDEKKEKITLIWTSLSDTYTILRLTSKEFWYKDLDGDEFHVVPF